MTDLSHISIFEGLPEAELSALQELCITRTYPKNTVIINEGDQANAMFICTSGKVKVYVSGTSWSIQPRCLFGSRGILLGRELFDYVLGQLLNPELLCKIYQTRNNLARMQQLKASRHGLEMLPRLMKVN